MINKTMQSENITWTTDLSLSMTKIDENIYSIDAALF